MDRTYFRNRDAGIPGTQFAVDPNDQGTTTLTLPSESSELPIAPGRMQPGDYVKTAPATWFGMIVQDEINIDTGLTDEQFSDLQNSYLDAVLDTDAGFYSDSLTDEELAEGATYNVADFDDASRERAVRDLHAFITDNRTLIDNTIREYGEAGIVDPVQRIGREFWLTRNFNGGFERADELTDETRLGLTDAAERAGELQSQPRGRNLTF